MLVMPSDPQNLSNISLRGIRWWSSVRIATSTAEDLREIPSWGTEIPQDTGCSHK